MQDDFDPYREWPNARGRDVIVTRKSGRLKKLIILAALSLVALLVMIRLTAARSDVAPVEQFDPGVAPTAPAPTTSIDTISTPGALRSYALEVTELDGLPPDASPGTLLELWVTWEPPITRRIQVQKLIPEVRLERIVPNIVPEGPATALLSVRTRDISDLLYGDRFGNLSVTVLPGPD